MGEIFSDVFRNILSCRRLLYYNKPIFKPVLLPTQYDRIKLTTSVKKY